MGSPETVFHGLHELYSVDCSWTLHRLHEDSTLIYVEVFPPPGHTGVWCSGNTPSSALCNEESCGSIPSTSDSFYENSNMVDVRRNLPFTISGHGDTHTVAVIPTLT